MEQELINIKKHLEKVGFKCEDKVTGFKGVITSIAFDLYGCIQVIVVPEIDKDEKMPESRWFDIGRLKITSDYPVMEQPSFDFGPVAEGKKGPAEKPASYIHD